MTEYRWAEPREEGDVVDLINFVFSQTARPHDFEKLIPKVYAHPGFACLHAVAAEAGRLTGTIAMLPVEARLSPSLRPLRGGYIGSVAVHPRFRGAGIMRSLMAMQIAKARAREYDFMALGGQRQRYRHYGFETSCGVVRFSLNRSNARHDMPQGGEFSFEAVTGPGHPALSFMAALHEKQPFSCLRPRDRFFETLLTYGGVPWAIKKGDAWAGYLVRLDDSVIELALENESDLSGVLGAWLRQEGSCALLCPAGMTRRLQCLDEIAEGAELADSQMIKVLNWEKVLEAAFQCRAENAPLPEGRRVLRVESLGAWALEAKDGSVTVTPAEEGAELVLSEQKAVSLLFSPLTAWLSPDPLLRAWLPLPMYFPIPDQF